MSLAHAQRERLLADALDCSRRGWIVIPMSLTPKDKKPLVPWGRYKMRSLTEASLRKQMARPITNGIAVIAGAGSGNLAIRDFDGGPEYAEFCDRYPTLSRSLPTARTRRGHHVWHLSDLQKTVDVAGGEFRGGSTLTVAPHSRRGDFIYDWVNPLPKGPLPLVEHTVFIGRDVAETPNAISVLSASLQHAPITVEDVINSTQPQAEGERNLRILALARGLKLNCGVPGASAAIEHVRRWHQRALPIISTKGFTETWADFVHAWERARHPLGLDLVDAAALQVDPHDLPEAATKYDSETMRRLVALCEAMAKLNGGKFFLSSHDAAERLNVEPMTAYRLLKLLCFDGVLKCTDPGNQRKAARYTWIGAPDAEAMA